MKRVRRQNGMLPDKEFVMNYLKLTGTIILASMALGVISVVRMNGQYHVRIGGN